MGGYNCFCLVDVMGVYCEELVVIMCLFFICFNNGVCFVFKGKVCCFCCFGYVGLDCFIECRMDCLNGGKCVRVFLGFLKCVCLFGY